MLCWLCTPHAGCAPGMRYVFQVQFLSFAMDKKYYESAEGAIVWSTTTHESAKGTIAWNTPQPALQGRYLC